MPSAICEKCETLPTLLDGDRHMFIWPPLGHTSAKVKAAAKPFANVTSFNNGIALRNVEADHVTQLLSSLDEKLTRQEKHDANCLMLPDREEPSIADFNRMTTLGRVIALYGGRWLIDILSGNRLDTLFQPILDGSDPHIPFAHECLLRWRDEDGSLRPPGDLFEKAKEADLLFQLDRQAREVNIANAQRQGVKSKIFLNFTPTAIYDPQNCLRTTFRAIETAGISPDQIVFEIVETERIDDPSHLKSILDYYRNHGFGIALDDLGAGHSTLKLLGELRPDYVKLDMHLVRNVHMDHFKAELVKRVISLSHQFGIKVIAEGIESFEESAWLQSQGIDYMQGFFFARPAPAPLAFLDRRQT